MISRNIAPELAMDKAENYRPTSTRLSWAERLLIKRAILRLEERGERGYNVSSFLRRGAKELAEKVLA